MNLRFVSREEIIVFFCLLVIAASSLSLFYQMSPDYFQKQIFFWAVGIAVYFAIKPLPFHPKDWQGLDWLIYLGVILFLATPLLFGQNVRGSARWIEIGGISFQPSEIAKPFFIFAITSFSFRWKENFKKQLFFPGLISFLPVSLVFIQPDLGSAIVFITSAALAILLVCKNKWPTIKIYSFLTVAAFLIGGIFLPSYQKERITSFLHPQSDPLGSGYNLIQSKIAIGSGGWLGRGLGGGEQTRLMFLPEKHTDFAFASFAEGSGFSGVTLVLTAYLILFFSIKRFLKKNNNPFEFTFKIVLLFQLWLQATINIGMNLGMAPITGLTLPFFSYGGSSILASFISLAFIFK